MAPLTRCSTGSGSPTSSPHNGTGRDGTSASVSAAVPPWDAPTMACPPGARPLLAASQSGSSAARNVSHCLLPSCSQFVYRLNAPPAGATTDMPLPASVFIALPAVTQLLTSGPALKASSRKTACGPPARKATGMSRPIAADGTIRYSTPSARAIGAAGGPHPSGQHHGQASLAPTEPHTQSPHGRVGSAPPQGSEPHHRGAGRARKATAATPRGSPPPAICRVPISRRSLRRAGRRPPGTAAAPHPAPAGCRASSAAAAHPSSPSCACRWPGS